MTRQRRQQHARAQARGWLTGIITQNVDGLHQRAGNANVIELHGTLSKVQLPHVGVSTNAQATRQVVCTSCKRERDRVGLQAELQALNPRADG
jgi:NAD-dependent SIR2 family protein deacetylase